MIGQFLLNIYNMLIQKLASFLPPHLQPLAPLLLLTLVFIAGSLAMHFTAFKKYWYAVTALLVILLAMAVVQ